MQPTFDSSAPISLENVFPQCLSRTEPTNEKELKEENSTYQTPNT
jgi:hypothetical protein